jgi:hypothetical protein
LELPYWSTWPGMAAATTTATVSHAIAEANKKSSSGRP